MEWFEGNPNENENEIEILIQPWTVLQGGQSTDIKKKAEGKGDQPGCGGANWTWGICL